MRIAHIIDEPYDSGITRYALRAAAGLAERGHPSIVWGVMGSFAIQEAERLGLPTQGYTHPWLNLAPLRKSFGEAGCDAVVAHTGSAHTLAIALASWHGTRIQRLLEGHGAVPHPMARMGHGMRHGRSIPVLRTRGDSRPIRRRPGQRLLWSRTAGLIAANRTILSEFERLCPVPGLHSACIYEGSEDPGSFLPPMAGAPLVGIVSRLDPVKGHGVFLRAAKLVLERHPDTRFLLVGRKENVKPAELLEEAHRLGLAERIELTGHVPDVFSYMRRCHVGVIASVGSEAVSRAAVEWMAVGRPLVATRVGCLPEYVADGETGLLVEPREEEPLARAIGSLVGDSYLRERMGRQARARFESLFTLRRFLDETERFYGRVIGTLSPR
ncbi:MAG: glycosyltransferase family 4 protein [Elusimicrobiota bacterium]